MLLNESKIEENEINNKNESDISIKDNLSLSKSQKIKGEEKKAKAKSNKLYRYNKINSSLFKRIKRKNLGTSRI